VVAGTTVTLTAQTDQPVDGTGEHIDIVPFNTSTPSIGWCQTGSSCSGQFSLTEPGSVTFQAFVDDSNGVVQVQSNTVTVTWTTGGGTTCGTIRGQHCTAIWTDKPQYQVGDTITYCYSVPQPAHVRIIDVEADGTSQVVVDGNDDGTGGCKQAQITPPTGTEQLLLTVYDQTGGLIGQAQTSFQVVGAPVAATPTATQPIRATTTPLPTASPTPAQQIFPTPPVIPTNTPTPIPTEVPVPTDTPEPVDTPTPTPPERFIMFIRGICAEPTFFCGNPRQRYSPESYADGFKDLMSALGAAGFKYTAAYFSYWIRTDQDHPRWYYPNDTHENLAQSSWQLDSQLRAILKAHPHATIDLVGHSLGGVVAAFWVANYATDDMLEHIHSLITFDSPLEGIHSFAAIEGYYLSGPVWDDLHPASSQIAAIDSADSGVVPQLDGPGDGMNRLHTIGNNADKLILASESWLPGAQDNRAIDNCSGDQPLCHSRVLHSPKALGWATSWIRS